MMTEAVFTGSTDEDLQLGKVSRVQFQLLGEGATLMLEDKSMNGIYVNRMKLGKGRRRCLNQENIIFILQMDFEVFFYITEARLMQM